MLLSAVMSDRISAQEFCFAPDLHRVTDQGDVDLAASERVADAVIGAGEAHRAVASDLADDDVVGGWPCRSSCQCLPLHVLVLFGKMPTGVRGHEHGVVEDLDQAVVTDELDGLPRQVAADVVLERVSRLNEHRCFYRNCEMVR